MIPIIEQRVVDATIIVGVEILLVIGHVFVKILVFDSEQSLHSIPGS